MAKRFFYVSAAILCLAISYHLGASIARAEFSNGVFFATHGSRAAAAYPDGTVWINNGSPGGWSQSESAPIPLSEGPIALFTGSHAVTVTGYVWENETNYWEGLGTIPGSTDARRESFGSVKAKYR